MGRLHRGLQTHIPSSCACCLLSVDDEVAILYARQAILQGAGYDVLNACDGEQALHIFASYSAGIDLVLLDYAMPGIDGGMVAREMRRRTPGVPIILVSASIVPQEVFACVNGCVDKGQSPRVLLDEIARLTHSVHGRRRPPAAVVIPRAIRTVRRSDAS